jgi:hypothetical protein
MLHRGWRVVIAVVAVLAGGLGSAAASTAQAPSPFVTRIGTTLFVDGHPYRYTGTNALELATSGLVRRGL